MQSTWQSVSAVGIGALFAMTMQKSISSMLLHESTTRVVYPVAVAVCVGEVIKMVVSLLIVCYESTRRQKRTWSDVPLWQSLVSTKGFALFVPAALYVVQNNLYMFAASHLTPTVFQAFWQLRIISTAFFSNIILQKRFSRAQYISMALLICSIVMIQVGSRNKYTLPEKAIGATSAFKARADTMIGSLAMLCACVLSGLAGVLLERIYTDGTTNLWVANVHLSVFSLPPAIVAVFARLLQDQQQSGSNHLDAFGHSGWPWVAVALHSLGGVLTALVTKHAGNIAQNFSGAIAISLTFLLSTSGILPGDPLLLTWKGLSMVWTGIAVLAYSTWLYLKSPAARTAPPSSSSRHGYAALASTSASAPPSEQDVPNSPTSTVRSLSFEERETKA